MHYDDAIAFIANFAGNEAFFPLSLWSVIPVTRFHEHIHERWINFGLIKIISLSSSFFCEVVRLAFFNIVATDSDPLDKCVH